MSQELGRCFTSVKLTWGKKPGFLARAELVRLSTVLGAAISCAGPGEFGDALIPASPSPSPPPAEGGHAQPGCRLFKTAAFGPDPHSFEPAL